MSVEQREAHDALEPFKEQEPFLWDDKRYLGYLSGVGAGKTAVGVMRDALNMEVWNPGHMGAIVAPTTQMIKNAILPLMREFGLMERWEYKSPQSEQPGIISPNGSRAVILSADDKRQVERLASLNLAWFHIDESRDVPERARQILIQRLRKGDYTNGYFTSTPRGHNHDYEFFVGTVDAEQYEYGDATIYEAEDRLAITGVPTDANPHLDRDDVRAIRDAHPSGVLEQEVEGLFVEIGSGVFKLDMLSFVSQDALNPEHSYQYVIGVDPATKADSQAARESDSDYWAATLLAVHQRHNKAFALDAIRERGLSLEAGVSWVQQIADSVQNPHIFVESNQAQRWLAQSLGETGLRVSQVNTSRNKEERLIDLSVPIERSDIVFVNRDVDPQLGYDPRWRDLVQELLAFPEGSHDDLADSLEIALNNANLSTGLILGSNPYDGESNE